MKNFEDIRNASEGDVLHDLLKAEREGEKEGSEAPLWSAAQVAEQFDENKTHVTGTFLENNKDIQKMSEKMQEVAEEQPDSLRRMGVSENIVKPFEQEVQESAKTRQPFWRRLIG